VGPQKRLINDSYNCEQDEERIPMGWVPNKSVGGTTTRFFTPTELYSSLKNIAVMECPNC
jgi:hypothetical protein